MSDAVNRQKVKRFTDAYIKTPYGCMQLLGVTTHDNAHYVCTKEITSDNWRFFRATLLNTDKLFTGRQVAAIVLVAVGLLLVFLGVIQSIASTTVTKEITTFANNGAFTPTLANTLMEFAGSPLPYVLGVMIMGAGAVAAMRGDILFAVPSILSGAAFLKMESIVEGFAAPPAPKVVVKETTRHFSFEPGLLQASLMSVGLFLSIFMACLAWRLRSRLSRLRGVPVATIGIFDLFAMREDPQLPVVVKEAFHLRCDPKNF